MRTLALAAGLAVAALPLSASAFNRSRPQNNPSGPCLYWPQVPVPFSLNQAGSKDATAAGSLAAARRSFETWTLPSCTHLQFRDMGDTDRTDVGFNPKVNATDNLNLIVWRDKKCTDAAPAGDPCFALGTCANTYNCWEQQDGTIALTTTTYSNKTGEILDADIELNGSNFIFTAQDGSACSTAAPDPAHCPSGWQACPVGKPFYCAELAVDPSNCGACGTVCSSPVLCSSGKCVASCDPGLAKCPSEQSATYCANFASDASNCGECGRTCIGGGTCSAGRCVEPCVATDVENTLTHEIGHFIGLDHVNDANATMYSRADIGETKKRSLAQDDIDGDCTIYPAGAAPTTCGDASNNLTGSGGGCTCASAGAGPLIALAGALLLGLRRASLRRP